LARVGSNGVIFEQENDPSICIKGRLFLYQVRKSEIKKKAEA
jgi:hypothetical protein